jgi:hypothetical protein
LNKATGFREDASMQRPWSVGLAVGIAVTVWTVVSRRRSRTRRRENLGTVSDAWLHDPRSYPAE